MSESTHTFHFRISCIPSIKQHYFRLKRFMAGKPVFKIYRGLLHPQIIISISECCKCAHQRVESACAIAQSGSESSQGTLWLAKDPKHPQADIED